MVSVKSSIKCIYSFFTKENKPKWQEFIEAVVVIGVAFFVLRTYVFGLYHVPSGSAEPNLLVGDRVLGNKMIYRFFREPKRGEFVMFDHATFKYNTSSKINYLWQKYVGFGIPLLGLSDGPVNVVKRVIGVPGDIVEGRVEDGSTAVYLNGKRLDEPYMNKNPLIALNKKVGLFPIDSIGPFRIPSFLVQQDKRVHYTYVMDKPLEEQPYYNMKRSEIIDDPFSSHPILLFPKEPTRKVSGEVVDNFYSIIPKDKYWVMGDSRQNSEDSRFWGLLDESLIQGKASVILYSVDSEEPLWLFEFIKHPFTFLFKYVRWNRSLNLL